MSSSVVEVWRDSVVESVHNVHVAVLDARGRLRAASGSADFLTFARSAVKPLQALPLLEDGVAERYDFGGPEIAVCCGSHNAETCHIELVRNMLRRIGAHEDALACGPHAPMGKAAAAALAQSGDPAGRIHNNCSGKHTGMLALARYYGWPLAGYHQPEHPVQLRMLKEVSRWTGVPRDEIHLATDGCGVVTFAVPLARLAAAFASLAAAARRGDAGPARVVDAMVRHPEYVAGMDRLCTALMRVAAGRIFVKVGAEGVYLAGIPGAELGVAIKVEDGATRAAEPALIGTLRSLGLLTDEEVADLSWYAEPDLLNTRQERVGTIRAHIKLEVPK